MKSKRKTAQKRSIEQVFLETNQPLTPQEALSAAQVTAPSLGIATVYRYLKEALDEGRIHRVEIPGQPPRYELARDTRRHHFHCKSCGQVFSLPRSPQMVIPAPVPDGFEVSELTLFLAGTCRDCTDSVKEDQAQAS